MVIFKVYENLPKIAYNIDMIIQMEQDKYHRLSDSEKQVINFLNENEHRIPQMSITDIAEETFTSTSTVSRTIKKAGFSGIAQFKFKIMEQLEGKANMPSSTYLNTVLDKSYQESVQTIENISIPSVLQAIEYIEQANRIFIFARGLSSLSAQEFATYLEILEYNVVLVNDVLLMKDVGQIIHEGDVAIFLTLQNSTPELSIAARVAKNKGANVVVCTCKEGTIMEDYADVVIMGHTEQIMETGNYVFYSRIPMYIITRAIIEFLNKERTGSDNG